MLIIIFMLLFGWACSYIAKDKRRDHVSWFVIGALTGFVGLIIIAVLSPLPSAGPQSASNPPTASHDDREIREIVKKLQGKS